jgi:ribosome-interacting GTPase 1
MASIGRKDPVSQGPNGTPPPPPPPPSSVARTCNLILIVLDVLKPLGHKNLIEHELEGFGIRLNKKPPNIGYKRKDKGGINFTATVRTIHSVTSSIQS